MEARTLVWLWKVLESFPEEETELGQVTTFQLGTWHSALRRFWTPWRAWSSRLVC